MLNACVNAQAIPYCWMLFVVPMHLLTHELLLFATGIWTANIHDNIDGRSAAPWVVLYPQPFKQAERYNFLRSSQQVSLWAAD